MLDAATGTGFHSVTLAQQGFDVTSVDGSLPMLDRAIENGRRHGVELDAVHCDWRRLTTTVTRRFDALICLGNSLTFLFSEEDRRRTMAEFRAVLKPEGLLVIDHRNYDRLLAGDSGDLAVEFDPSTVMFFTQVSVATKIGASSSHLQG